MNEQLRMGTVEWAMLLSLSVLWSGSFFFVEIALRELGPLLIVAIRVGIAALVLHVVVIGRGLRMPTSWHTWFAFAVMGILNNAIPFSLIVWGQSHINSGTASILNATAPMFTCILAHLLTRDERLSVSKISGIGSGFLGVLVLGSAEELSWQSLSFIGQLAVLAASLSYAFAAIWGRRLRDHPSEVSAAGMLTISTLVLLPLVLVFEGGWQYSLSVEVLVACAGLSILSTAVAYLLYFRILGRAGATNVLLVTFLIPPIAVLLGVVFLNETLSWRDGLAMVLIVAGLVLINDRIPIRRRGAD